MHLSISRIMIVFFSNFDFDIRFFSCEMLFTYGKKQFCAGLFLSFKLHLNGRYKVLLYTFHLEYRLSQACERLHIFFCYLYVIALIII